MIWRSRNQGTCDGSSRRVQLSPGRRSPCAGCSDPGRRGPGPLQPVARPPSLREDREDGVARRDGSTTRFGDDRRRKHVDRVAWWDDVDRPHTATPTRRLTRHSLQSGELMRHSRLLPAHDRMTGMQPRNAVDPEFGCLCTNHSRRSPLRSAVASVSDGFGRCSRRCRVRPSSA